MTVYCSNYQMIKASFQLYSIYALSLQWSGVQTIGPMKKGLKRTPNNNLIAEKFAKKTLERTYVCHREQVLKCSF